MLRELVHPFITIAGIAFRFAVRLYNRRHLKILHRQCGDPRRFVYFAYSESHQFKHFLGDFGLLAGVREVVVEDDWRAGWETYKRAPTGTERGSPFEGISFKRWRVSNMRKHLPFVVVFDAACKPHAFHLSSPYRARRRTPAELDRLQAELLQLINRTRQELENKKGGNNA